MSHFSSITKAHEPNLMVLRGSWYSETKIARLGYKYVHDFSSPSETCFVTMCMNDISEAVLTKNSKTVEQL